MPSPLLLTYHTLKAELSPLPSYPKLKAAVSARVEGLAPKPTETEIDAETHGILALAAVFVGYRRVKRQAVKAQVWGRVASILAGEEVEACAECAEIDAEAAALAASSTVAIQAGVAALAMLKVDFAASLPAINEEAF